jgi:hypothetical protein
MICRLLLSLSLALDALAATTITVRPSSSTPNSGDAYLRAAAPATNYGSAGALVISGSGNTNGQFASVLKFDLSLATSAFDAAYGAGNWTLTSLQIELTAVEPNNPTFNPNAAGALQADWLATDSWIESGASSITWNGLTSLILGGSESLGTLAFNGALGTTQYALNASLGFANDLANGGITSIYLNASTDPNASLVVNSRNFGTLANRPALILTASPEPSRAVLLLLGIAVIIGRRGQRASGHLRH